MKKRNGLIKITVIIGIVLNILVGRVKSSENGKMSFKVYNGHAHIQPCAIISESDTARLEDCMKEDTRYVFIKNLSANKKNYKKFNSDNTTDIIVVEDNNEFGSYRLYTCLYKEVEENGKIKKKYVSPEEATGKEKKMLIVPNSIDDNFIGQIEGAIKQVDNPYESTKIKSTIELMKRVLNSMICKLYINKYTSRQYKKNLKKHLEEIGMKNTTAYSLVSREVQFTEPNNLIKLFKYFEDKLESIRSLVYNDALENELTKKKTRNIKYVKRVFLEETKTITEKIKNINQSYTEKEKDNLLHDIIIDLRMLITMLAGNKIDHYTYIDTETLKDEILKEDNDKVKNRLFEVIDKCIKFPNSSMVSIGKLSDEIYNNENISYDTEENENEMTTELSTEIEEKMIIESNTETEEEEFKMQVKQTFERVIKSYNVTSTINSYMTIESVKPWNKGLMKLLLWRLIEIYNKFNGTAEELIKEIKIDIAQINSEVQNEREKSYKNAFIIIQIVENVFAEINSIIKNRVDTDNDALIKKTTKEDNEKIISILESISIETDIVTEEEQRVIKVLEDISLEEEQEDMLLEEEESRDIRTILSEIAEEYSKPEIYEVTDKPIQMKKQEIARIIFKKFPIITEDSNLPKIKEYLTEIVDSIVDILVDGTVDKTKYKGLNLAKDEKYFRAQDLISTLDFVEKYTCLGFNNFYINDYKFIATTDFITQMKKIISTENEKAVDFLLSDISEIKINIYKFIGLIWSFKEIDSNIDHLKQYNEFWLNATSFNYHSKPVSQQSIDKPAYIMYKSEILDLKLEKTIKPTNENLQAFMKARTAQGIKKIPEYIDTLKA